MNLSDQYFNNRIAKLKSTLLGLAIATPALVITVIEILSQTI